MQESSTQEAIYVKGGKQIKQHFRSRITKPNNCMVDAWGMTNNKNVCTLFPCTCYLNTQLCKFMSAMLDLSYQYIFFLLFFFCRLLVPFVILEFNITIMYRVPTLKVWTPQATTETGTAERPTHGSSRGKRERTGHCLCSSSNLHMQWVPAFPVLQI